MKLIRQLYIQVLIGIVLAVLLGIASPDIAIAMKPLGDAFIGLLRMLLAPIIFCSVVLGLTHVRDMGQLGRLAFKALLYFEVMSTVGMVLGFIVVNLVQPGVGLHATNLAVNPNVAQITSAASHFTAVGFFLSIIPNTPGGRLREGGDPSGAVHLDPDGRRAQRRRGRAGLDDHQGDHRRASTSCSASSASSCAWRRSARSAPWRPPWAHSATATLLYLAKVVILYWLTSVFFVVVVLGLVVCGHGRAVDLQAAGGLIREELLLVLGTASGEVALPRLMLKLEQAGCDEAIVGFVLPGGYSFNLDGTGIYMAIAGGRSSRRRRTRRSDLWQQVGVLAILLLTSKGGTTVAGGAFIKLAATLQIGARPAAERAGPAVRHRPVDGDLHGVDQRGGQHRCRVLHREMGTRIRPRQVRPLLGRSGRRARPPVGGGDSSRPSAWLTKHLTAAGNGP